MGCGCTGSSSSYKPYSPEVQPDIRIPAGAKVELRGFDENGKSKMVPCKYRYATLVLQKDGTYTDMIICQNKKCPLFNLLTCPCDCEGCPWNPNEEDSDGETSEGSS